MMGGPGKGGSGMMGPGMAGGSGMMGGRGSRGGVGGEGSNEITGQQGPVFQEQQQQDIQVLERTDFIVQFIWKPSIERDRQDTDPRLASEGNSAGQPAQE